jgi:protein kinase A
LVSRVNSVGEKTAYALKVQSKYELVKEDQVKAVVDEKNIMSQLHHPFLIQLVATYQDSNFAYILLQLVQGGELYTTIHTATHDYLPETHARFYAACVVEGLGFM